jgi:molecular chaperone DnaK
LAYGLDKKKDETIAVYDFGGGTFDISILEVGDNVVEVKSTNGDTHLGGDDVDQVLIDWMIAEFKGRAASTSPTTRWCSSASRTPPRRPRSSCRQRADDEINLPFLSADASGPKHLVRLVSRAQFERMIEPIIERTLEPCRQALRDAGLTAKQIHEVILVGGSTRIPLVREEGQGALRQGAEPLGQPR